MLADVDAKRRIIAMHSSGAQFPDFDGGYETAMDDVIALLALPDVAHPRLPRGVAAVRIVYVRFSPYSKTARRRPDTAHVTRLTSEGRTVGIAARWRGRWHGLMARTATRRPDRHL